jgi:hypothetical protein
MYVPKVSMPKHQHVFKIDKTFSSTTSKPVRARTSKYLFLLSSKFEVILFEGNNRQQQRGLIITSKSMHFSVLIF